jgi:hypothetical protein
MEARTESPLDGIGANYVDVCRRCEEGSYYTTLEISNKTRMHQPAHDDFDGTEGYIMESEWIQG